MNEVKNILSYMVMLLLLAVSVSGFDSSLRSGPQPMSDYSKFAVCDIVSPFALDHVITFEDGQQGINYSEDELIALTDEVSENVSIEVSTDVVEGFLLDLEGECGARVIVEPEPEEEVPIIVDRAETGSLSPVTGLAVALEPGEEPTELPFPDINLGEKKPSLLTRIIFVIKELRFKDIINFEITGLRPYLLPIILVLTAFVFLRITRGRGK